MLGCDDAMAERNDGGLFTVFVFGKVQTGL